VEKIKNRCPVGYNLNICTWLDPAKCKMELPDIPFAKAEYIETVSGNYFNVRRVE